MHLYYCWDLCLIMSEVGDIVGDILWDLRYGCWDLLYVVEIFMMLFSTARF